MRVLEMIPMVAGGEGLGIGAGRGGGVVTIRDMRGGALADGAGVVGKTRQPDHGGGEHVLFRRTGIDPDADIGGKARVLGAGGEEDRFA